MDGRKDPIRVLIVDDHRLFAEGLRVALRQHGIETAGIASSGEEAVTAARTLRPEVILLDLGLGDMDGLAVGQRIIEDCPEIRVIALTALDDVRYVRETLRVGFHGYFLKHGSLSDLLGAVVATVRSQAVIPADVIRAVLEMDAAPEQPESAPAILLAKQLTKREREVLALLCAGSSGKEIANRLFLSPKTVRTHVQNILTKLQVHSRLEAVAFAIQHGLAGRIGVRGSGDGPVPSGSPQPRRAG